MRKKRNSSIEIHVSHLIGRFDSKKERKKEIHKNNTKEGESDMGKHILCVCFAIFRQGYTKS